MTENEERLGPEFERALGLRDEGQLVRAKNALDSLLTKLGPADIRLRLHVHMQLGNIWDQLGDHSMREFHFRSAVDASPRSQLASLGLYHTLVDRGQRDDALEEMVRLLRLSKSDLYVDLLVPGYESTLTVTQKVLVSKARELLARHCSS
jgi:hypothetical protein